LDQLGTVEEPSPSEMAQGAGKFAAMDGASEKYGFRSIYSVGGFIGVIESKLLDSRALGNL
jgi:hypothetical protein